MAQPLIFAAKGLMSPDTRIIALGQEYHVHSTVLKQNSRLFNLFMESSRRLPLAQDANMSASSIKYVWSTHCNGHKDEDRNTIWSLVAGMREVEVEISDYFNAQELECQQKAFESFLSAMYGKPYRVSNADVLRFMINMADKYSALKAVSRTLTEAMLAGELHIDDPKDYNYASGLLDPACKVRNATLFRECIISLAGVYQESGETPSDVWGSAKIKDVLCKAINDINHKVAACQRNILTVSMEHDDVKKAIHDIVLDPEYRCLPVYYKQIGHILANRGGDMPKSVSEAFQSILELLADKLLFRNTSPLESRDECGVFLCATVEDEDLPWDITDIDW